MSFSLRQIIRNSSKPEQVEAWTKAVTAMWYGNKSHADYLAEVLRLYNYEWLDPISDWQGNTIAGVLSFEQLQINTWMNDVQRKEYIVNALRGFRENPEFGQLSDVQIEGIIRIHNKYANTWEFENQWDTKTFFDLSKKDRKNIKKELEELGINKNWQDLLVYHGICSFLKGFFVACLIAGVAWGIMRWNGYFDNNQAGTTPTPVITPNPFVDKEKKIPMIIDADSLTRHIAESQGILFIWSDTIHSFLPRKLIINPSQGVSGNAIGNARRKFETYTWIGTAEMDIQTDYQGILWYTLNDLQNASITWTLDDSQPTSTIDIRGLKGLNIVNFVPTDNSVTIETDFLDNISEWDKETIRRIGRDSAMAFVKHRLLPAWAYHTDYLLRSLALKQWKALTNLYYWGVASFPNFLDKTIVVNIELNFDMPAWHDTRRSWPYFTSNRHMDNFRNENGVPWISTPAGSRATATLQFIKLPWQRNFVPNWTPSIFKANRPQENWIKW